MISAVMSVHNEGHEVRRTIESIRSHTRGQVEIVIVDDASTDGCCVGLDAQHVRVLRHERRLGVAASRDRAVQSARGDVLAFLDGHQRVTDGCLNCCAEMAHRQATIVWPDVRGFTRGSQTVHGARFRQCPKKGYFTAHWRLKAPRTNPSRITSLRCPGYVMSRQVYDQVRWIRGLRNWGGSEQAISLKAFFLDVPILHLCGALSRHMFKKKLEYDATWDDVWRNHALIARVCFDDRTWYDYWLPCVFQPHLNDEARRDLESDAILAQHQEFLSKKVRRDVEFWTDLLSCEIPGVLRSRS